MDTAFSNDYYQFVLRKQIIHVTFSDSEKLPQDHYKLWPRVLLWQIKESIGYKDMLQYTSALIKH